jgi:hypothetical protein
MIRYAVPPTFYLGGKADSRIRLALAAAETAVDALEGGFCSAGRHFNQKASA